MFCNFLFTIIALSGGVIALFSMFFLIMGFGLKGIIGGSPAAYIQSYIGMVNKGSAFSLFQSIGTTIGFLNAAIVGIILTFFYPSFLSMVYENVFKFAQVLKETLN